MAAPHTFQTARLRLRRPVQGDAGAIFSRYASDVVATRLMAWPRHQSLADTAAFLASSDAEWARTGAGPYLIEALDTGLVLGSTGLLIAAGDPAEAITGYILAPDSWGRGYATEALLGVVDLAPGLGIHRLSAAVHPDNAASIRVLAKAGFTREPAREPSVKFPNLPPGESPMWAWEYARYFARRL